MLRLLRLAVEAGARTAQRTNGKVFSVSVPVSVFLRFFMNRAESTGRQQAVQLFLAFDGWSVAQVRPQS